MSFKVIKTENNEPQYCDYIQEKINIAKQFGAVYELNDEDYRIQGLYNRKDLRTEEVIKSISRVRSPEDGKEYLVVGKDVNFYNKDTGIYVDRYSTREGIQEVPIIVTNDLGNPESTQNRIKYTIPFSAEKVDEMVEDAENSDVIPLQFYNGSATSNRTIRSKTTVGNLDLFKGATWQELRLARENKTVSSMVNNLDELREINNSKVGRSATGGGRQSISKFTERAVQPEYQNTEQGTTATTNQYVENRSGIPTQVIADGGNTIADYKPTEGIVSTVISTNSRKNKLNTEQDGSKKNNNSSKERNNSSGTQEEEKESSTSSTQKEKNSSSSGKVNNNSNNSSDDLDIVQSTEQGNRTPTSGSNNNSKQTNK
jgi:hypothetical protein